MAVHCEAIEGTCVVSMASEPRALQCDMRRECTEPVTHIGEKGYTYCAEHVADRRGVERCRRMRAWEVDLLRAGKPLPSYEPRALGAK